VGVGFFVIFAIIMTFAMAKNSKIFCHGKKENFQSLANGDETSKITRL
jgi:hypothetical protein